MSRFAALVVFAALAYAESLPDSARSFAKRIAAALAPGEACAIDVRNASSLSQADASSVRQALVAESHCTGAGAAVSVTLSENPEGFLWVAEISRNEKREAVLIEHPRGAPSVANTEMRAGIQKELLFPESEAPILDVALLEDAAMVLQPDGIGILAKPVDRTKAWSVTKFMPLEISKPWPRDLRGRILVEGDAFRAFLPGLSCEGTVKPEPSLQCREGNDEWPAAPPKATIAAGANYFTMPGGARFFAGAKAGSNWVLSATDGRTQFYDETMTPVAAYAGWGSELAAIAGSCGRGWQVLASKPGDWDEPDTVQAFEVVDRHAEPVSAPVEMPGPVTALWQSANQRAVIAVSRNPKTGRYAVYKLSTYCGM